MRRTKENIHEQYFYHRCRCARGRIVIRGYDSLFLVARMIRCGTRPARLTWEIIFGDGPSKDAPFARRLETGSGFPASVFSRPLVCGGSVTPVDVLLFIPTPARLSFKFWQLQPERKAL